MHFLKAIAVSSPYAAARTSELLPSVVQLLKVSTLLISDMVLRPIFLCFHCVPKDVI